MFNAIKHLPALRSLRVGFTDGGGRAEAPHDHGAHGHGNEEGRGHGRSHDVEDGHDHDPEIAKYFFQKAFGASP